MTSPTTRSAAAPAMQAATRRAFGEPACHLRATAGGPRCGQVAANGRGWARTRYTADPAAVTCLKCRKALLADAAAATTPTPEREARGVDSGHTP